MASLVIAPFFGPALGPLNGGFAVMRFDWRWTQRVTLFFTVVFMVPCSFMQETYKKVILKRRVKRLGLKTAEPERTFFEAAKYFLVSTFLRPAHMAVTEPIVGFFSLYVRDT